MTGERLLFEAFSRQKHISLLITVSMRLRRHIFVGERSYMIFLPQRPQTSATECSVDRVGTSTLEGLKKRCAKYCVSPKTSPRSWDALYKELVRRPKIYAEQHQAVMRLYHPQHPDSWPLLSWWRLAEADQDHPIYKVVSRSSMLTLVETCRDMRLVLEHQGHHKEAQWLEKFVLEVFPRDKEFWGKSLRERLNVHGRILPSLQSFKET